MRASDLERQRTIDELRRHCAAGRIDVNEYAARIEKAMAATTLEELDHLRSDLPMMRIADPTGAGPGPIWARATLPAVGSGEGGEAGSSAGRKVAAMAVVLLSILVVLSVVILALIAEWSWAAVLVIGWLVGAATGRLSRRPIRR